MLHCVRNLECKRLVAAMISLLSDCTVLVDRVDALREERILFEDSATEGQRNRRVTL